MDEDPNMEMFHHHNHATSNSLILGQRPLLGATVASKQQSGAENQHEQREEFNLFALGEDMCIEICRFLTPKYLLFMGQTCQFFNELSNRDDLWHALHQKRFGKPALCDNPKFSYYIRRRLIVFKDFFMTQPLHPFYNKQRCIIKRSRSNKVYTLSLDKCPQFVSQNVRLGHDFHANHLLYAKKSTKCYLISTNKTFSATSIVGKLEFDNLTKTRFTVKDSDNHTVGTIIYKLNLLGMLGPRRFQMKIPPIDVEENAMQLELYSPMQKFGQHDMAVSDIATSTDHGILIPNKSPVWSNEFQQYLLDFGSHLQKIQSSVNNFKVENAEGETLWLLGKCHDSFCLDFQHPLSPLQAFALALSCFATHRNPTLVSFFDD